MTKKFLLFSLLSFILTSHHLHASSTTCSDPPQHPFQSGSGTQSDPYLICTNEQFQNMTFYTNLSDHYIQGADLDFSNPFQGPQPMPVGSEYQPFTGHYNGANYKISNINYNHFYSNNLGLFSVLDNGASLKNLKIENANISGANKVGIAVGYLRGGLIENVHVTGSGGGNYYIGSLVGIAENSARLEKVSSRANVQGGVYVGGIVGALEMNSLIKDCYTANPYFSASQSGGVAGQVGQSSISNCHASGNYNFIWDPVVASQWQGQFTGIFYNQDQVPGSSMHGQGLSGPQMLDQSIFEQAGWDFEQVWTMSTNYPVLKEPNNLPTPDPNVITFLNTYPGEEIFGLNFGNTPIFGAALTVIDIRNDSGAILNLVNTDFTDSHFQFSGGQYPGWAGYCGPFLMPNDTCRIELEFRPTDYTSYSGEMIIELEETGNSYSVSFPLEGNGY